MTEIVKQQNAKLIVLLGMTRNPSSPAAQRPDSAYRVKVPRASDAIGLVLRDAYERDLGLPEDMAALLNKISDRGGNNAQG